MPEATSNAAKLREFHRAIGSKPPLGPAVPDLALLNLRQTLIREEWAEVQEEMEALRGRLQAGEAVEPGDLAPLVHELADLLYVTYGALDQFGIDTDAVFAEVHRANMHKAAGPKRADGKQLKPEGWQPADVRSVIERG
ncbi:hypothetical protein D3875_09980 [Deinococcus cavernae]|uniref:Phosphoribosyl-ATP pyrophosphohydrolase n=1 Tax=Deinococcus cavernae TaxID=2320857 RepID=A0A418V6U8_9DEIO|nr:hypothetical protein [Deinococcus cavernae]RJF71838.1 hypothetical protein D3875_09980 [Deinococcus cavernae]